MYLAGPSPPFFSTEHTYRSVLVYSFGFYDSIFQFSFDTFIAASGYDELDRPHLVLDLFFITCPLRAAPSFLSDMLLHNIYRASAASGCKRASTRDW